MRNVLIISSEQYCCEVKNKFFCQKTQNLCHLSRFHLKDGARCW